MTKKDDSQPSNAYLNALNEAKQLIIKSQEYFLRSANRISMKVKLEHENNSIGLILCTDRNDVEVDYVLPEVKRPIGVTELKLSKVLPKELSGKLPDPEILNEKILQNLNKK